MSDGIMDRKGGGDRLPPFSPPSEKDPQRTPRITAGTPLVVCVQNPPYEDLWKGGADL